MSRASNIVRELVRHLGDDRTGLDLLNRLLEELDVRLCGLVPPPPALERAPEPMPEPDYYRPRRR